MTMQPYTGGDFIVFEAEDLGALVKRFQQAPAQNRIDFANTVGDLADRATRVFRFYTPRGATGNLARSTRAYSAVVYSPTEGSSAYITVFQPAMSMAIGFTPSMQYRPFVVAGRNPGIPPPWRALVAWVARKWRTPPGRATSQAAWRFAQHIGRFGTTPQPYPIDAFIELDPYIQQAANDLATKIYVRLTDYHGRI